jgi:hypothetical protein
MSGCSWSTRQPMRERGRERGLAATRRDGRAGALGRRAPPCPGEFPGRCPGYPAVVSASTPRLSKSLQDAFRELARIERALVEAGDRQMLARFGAPERGIEVAALFGYMLLATDEARTVDRLTYLPQAQQLIREYLELIEAPRAWDLERQSQGGGPNTQRPPTIVETTSASRSSQGSRSSTTRSAA